MFMSEDQREIKINYDNNIYSNGSNRKEKKGSIFYCNFFLSR